MAVGRICKTCGSVGCAVHKRGRPTYADTQRRKAAVEAHLLAHGSWCPGWNRPGHLVMPPNDLTADHIQVLALGGDPMGPLRVLCRSCNSSRGMNPAL